MKVQNSLYAVALIFCLAGCSLVEAPGNVEDMKQNMEKMKSTTESLERATEEMKGNTDELEGMTEELRNTTDATYTGLRKVQPAQFRLEVIEKIDKSSRTETKAALAGMYLVALEYQHWRGEDSDTAERRQEQIKVGVVEFLTQVTQFLPPEGVLSPFSVDAERKPVAEANSNTTRNFYAFASALHVADEDYLHLAKERGLETSMLDLIQIALTWNSDQPGDKPAYVKEIRKRAQIAEKLLQLNALSAAVLKAVAPGNLEDPEKGKEVLTQMLTKRWSANLAALNEDQVEDLSLKLKGAIGAARVLAEAKIEPKLDTPLRVMYGNAEIQADSADSDAKASAVREFAGVLAAFQKLGS